MAVEFASGAISIPDSEPTQRRSLFFLPDIPESAPDYRPLEPLQESAPLPPPPEPAPWTTTAEEWTIWINKRNAYADFCDKRRLAREFAAANDLLGVPFS